jgi:ABC-type transport system substrate-binding protein/DNA-binding SARP family transcriptional activator
MIDYRILGPLEVSADGRVIDIGGPKQRALLAILLLRANEPVPRDVLVHELWGERPPAGARGSVEVYVSRLRKALGAAGNGHVVVTRPGGYCLQLADGQLDVDRFERLVAEGRSALAANAHEQAGASLRAALRLWRGNALGDVGCEPFAQVETGRLEELRLGAVEDRIEADLTLGRHADLVSELEALVATHPLRERLTGQLMIALYRCGRQAEALEAYQAARRTLVEELGLEPGPALQRLERAILQQDASLELPGRAVAGPAPGPAPGPGQASPAGAGPRRHRGSVIAAAIAAVVLAATLVVAGTAHRGQAMLAGANGLVAIDTTSGRLVAAAPLNGAPEAVSGGARSVWVADPGGEAVTRIDPGSGAAVDRILVGGEPGSVVSGDGAIWAASTDAASVTRIDPVTGGVTQTIPLPAVNLGAIAYGAGRLWVADPGAHELFEIDPATGAPRRTLSLDLQPSAIAVGGGAIWVAGYDDATVVKLAPVSGRVTGRVHVGNGPAALAFGDGSLWVANSLDATVSRVDPRTLAVRTPIPVGSGPDALALGAGSVWAASQYSGTVSRIDPRRDQVVTRAAVGGAPTSLAMGGGRLWVAVAANGASHRGGTFVIATPVSLTSNLPTTLASVDPAFYNTAFNPQFTGLAYDSLVTFQQSPGAGGTRLVPDLALAIPAPADSGSTYAFRLRPGIRYSDGQVLRADDFRRGIQRLFRVQSPGASLFSGIVGATACARHPAGCDLSRGVVTDDAARTVVFHLTAPDPDFLFNLTQDAFAAPIPPGTPDHEITSHFVPGTGPYKIAAASATRIRFARNPFFREWSHAAQPAGNPDAIVWQTMPTVQDSVTAVEHGRADWMFGQIPRAQYQQLRLRAPSELHSSPQPGVDFAPLNTHIAPFNDVQVRRALNFAIDRRALVRLFGGPVFATVTCQPITPGLPGYRRYCPYTRHPRADGAYTGPDLAQARRLVAASGTAGERVDVWGMTDNPSVPRGVTAYFGGVLRALGYRVHLHDIPSATFTQTMRKGLQLSTDGDWAANYPDPASYVPQFFGCGGGTSNGYYCNPALDRQMRQARLLELSHPAKAAALWASIDRQITDDAVWVPTVNQREVDLVSSRLRNYENNPVWGLLVDQSWLR